MPTASALDVLPGILSSAAKESFPLKMTVATPSSDIIARPRSKPFSVAADFYTSPLSAVPLPPETQAFFLDDFDEEFDDEDFDDDFDEEFEDLSDEEFDDLGDVDESDFDEIVIPDEEFEDDLDGMEVDPFDDFDDLDSDENSFDDTSDDDE